MTLSPSRFRPVPGVFPSVRRLGLGLTVGYSAFRRGATGVWGGREAWRGCSNWCYPWPSSMLITELSGWTLFRSTLHASDHIQPSPARTSSLASTRPPASSV